MVTDLEDLLAFAKERTDWVLIKSIAQSQLHQNASAEEIYALLKDAIDTYTDLAPTLPTRLQQSAQQELEFLAGLLQQRLTGYMRSPSSKSAA